MKVHLRLAALVCGLMLVAAPAMAQVTITINDLTSSVTASGTGGFDSGGTASQPTVTVTALNEHVDWEGHFNSATPPTTVITDQWNLYEAGTVITGNVPAPGAILSDTLQLQVSGGTVAGFNTDFLIRFFSVTEPGDTGITALSPAVNLDETGAFQTFTVPGPTGTGPASVSTPYISASVESSDAVPEPATILLLGFGLFGVGFVGRKIKK